jgi:hypothetical protein
MQPVRLAELGERPESVFIRRDGVRGEFSHAQAPSEERPDVVLDRLPGRTTVNAFTKAPTIDSFDTLLSSTA